MSLVLGVAQSGRRLQEGEGDSYKPTIEAATGWKNYSAVAAKFGLTPADREKLTLPGPIEPADEFSGYWRNHHVAKQPCCRPGVRSRSCAGSVSRWTGKKLPAPSHLIKLCGY